MDSSHGHRWAHGNCNDDPVSTHPRAGRPAQPSDLIDVPALIAAYSAIVPDPGDPRTEVAFGTSGHRGCSLDGSFNEVHIVAMTRAICEWRQAQGIAGPLYLGRDSHALSEPAWRTAVEVLAGSDVLVCIDAQDGLTPTPAVSRAIVQHNASRTPDDPFRADGIVITPSHNPPRDGGFKYNPPDGGPAGTEITRTIQARANELMRTGLREVRRLPMDRALKADTTRRYDYLRAYVEGLPEVIDLEAIASAGVRIGADPLGGASVDYWGAIAETHRLDLTVVNPSVDPTWSFMTLDWDGRIRMDCSSPYAMASLVSRRGEFDIATGNDADADRHGIVTADGLMNPNHFLSVSIDYLLQHRPGWPGGAAIGKTVVSSSMIDRVVASLGRALMEVPVGFKWFVPGLLDGSIAFGGEESAGASFLRRDGQPWSTDKDGIIACLLASEILAVTGKSPSAAYAALTEELGSPCYARIDAPANREQKAALGNLDPASVAATELAGEPIIARLTAAAGNGAPIGGLKVCTENGWFAARPSGTEDVTKIYAESFLGPEHLAAIQEQATAIVAEAIGNR